MFQWNHWMHSQMDLLHYWRSGACPQHGKKPHCEAKSLAKELGSAALRQLDLWYSLD